MMDSTENIRWFADITLADRLEVGGKGGSLGELTRAGIAVPSGFVVTTRGFERVLAELEKESPIRARVDALALQDLKGVRLLSEEVRARFKSATLPPELCAEIAAAHARLCDANLNSPLAVRSSATTEDSQETSFAGLQDTYLWVKGTEAVLEYVRWCWASLYSVPSISYRLRDRVPENGIAIAVVVQKMIDARSAGVMFTRSPLTGDRSVITIESAWGLGSAVVSGEVTPDRFVLGKITGQISARDISDKRRQDVPSKDDGIKHIETPQELRHASSISDKELITLAEIGRKVERHYGKPQDIEWAIDYQGDIHLLQSRPETVWAQKDKVPVSRPAQSPAEHVMNIFGGRR